MFYLVRPGVPGSPDTSSHAALTWDSFLGKLSTVIHTYNLSTLEATTGELPVVQDLPGVPMYTISSCMREIEFSETVS